MIDALAGAHVRVSAPVPFVYTPVDDADVMWRLHTLSSDGHNLVPGAAAAGGWDGTGGDRRRGRPSVKRPHDGSPKRSSCKIGETTIERA
uniref:Linear gramicidin synthetase subunit D domain protein n=1 Tax=Mesocestoides corti TaxID=53468 RepID=A0A5K3EGJ8_MESCO